jgi:hypothetical protein
MHDSAERASNEAARLALAACLRGLVIDRGNSAMDERRGLIDPAGNLR